VDGSAETPSSGESLRRRGIRVVAAGNLYTAEAQLRGVTKYVRQ
jgi:hypothetical protein